MLISDAHRQRYLEYYASRQIESRPSIWLPTVEEWATRLGARTILDYGCGAARGISRFSKFAVHDYDPGVEGCSDNPEPADLVISMHALEHVEPAYVDPVIAHMVGLARKALLIVVSCTSSTKVLLDGTPWHIFVRDAEWWAAKLQGFDPQPVQRPGAEYAAIKRINGG